MTVPLNAYVLVGGWPGSGKSTLAAALAPELGLALLAKDELKESLMAEFGDPADVAASRLLGAAAVRILLRLVRHCPGAVIDSTWCDYTRPLLADLGRPVVEVRCRVRVETARERYRARQRAAGHLDHDRDESELWGAPVAPLGLGPLLEVDTEGPVDVAAVATRLRALTVRS